MRRTNSRPVFSFFGLMFGGLLLAQVMLVVLMGLLDGEDVLPRILSIPDLMRILAFALFATVSWYVQTYRDGV